MNDEFKAWVQELNNDPTFIAFRESVLRSECPALPSYRPGDPKSAGQQGEGWIYQSGVAEGYRLALLHFGVKL